MYIGSVRGSLVGGGSKVYDGGSMMRVYGGGTLSRSRSEQLWLGPEGHLESKSCFESGIANDGAGLLTYMREELMLDGKASLDPEAVGLGGGVEVEEAARGEAL